LLGFNTRVPADGVNGVLATPVPPAANQATYFIIATGNTFTGYVKQGQNNSAITEGKVDGH
jgi:hypothetical protein